MHASDVATERLILRLMPVNFLTLCLDGRTADAEAVCGFRAHPEWHQHTDFIRLRRDQCLADPGYRAWCVRAIVLRKTSEMIGHIGFHEAPNPPHLRRIASNAIEFGYTIYPEYRRMGYATEAVRGLMGWCACQNAVDNFVVSIAPDNAASQAIARRFGFVKVGEHMDEQDGLEDVLLLSASEFTAR